MHRQSLLTLLDVYERTWIEGAGAARPHAARDAAEERAIVAEFRRFVREEHECFERHLAVGHVTGSALVVSPGLDNVLLTLHAKLGKWLQLGGHADGEAEVHDVARREVQEESGLGDLDFLAYEPALGATRPGGAPLPFDFDRHAIPPRKSDPEHYHYDVRYLVVADPHEPLAITDESTDLRWFPLAEARALTEERSMIRQFDKLAWLGTRLELRASPLTRPGADLSCEAGG